MSLPFLVILELFNCISNLLEKDEILELRIYDFRKFCAYWIRSADVALVHGGCRKDEILELRIYDFKQFCASWIRSADVALVPGGCRIRS